MLVTVHSTSLGSLNSQNWFKRKQLRCSLKHPSNSEINAFTFARIVEVEICSQIGNWHLTSASPSLIEIRDTDKGEEEAKQQRHVETQRKLLATTRTLLGAKGIATRTSWPYYCTSYY